MHASSVVWVKQTSWIEQTGCITVTDRWIHFLFVMRNVAQQSMLSFLSMSVFFCNSWGSGFVFWGTVSCSRNEIKASAGKFSPDSLHITWLTLLSLWWYNPSAHRQTWAHLNAHLHTFLRTNLHTNINLVTAQAEWTPTVPYRSSCCLFRIQLADKAWSCSVLFGCLNPGSHTPNLGVHFNSISHLPAARMS